jgi:hypothetical protein
MGEQELEYFVAHHGAETLVKRLTDMSDELRSLRAAQESMRTELTRDRGIETGSIESESSPDERGVEPDDNGQVDDNT